MEGDEGFSPYGYHLEVDNLLFCPSWPARDSGLVGRETHLPVRNDVL